MAQALTFVFSTSGVVFAFFACVVAMAIWPRVPFVRRVVIALAVAYVAASTYGVPAAIARWWTRNDRPFEWSAPAAHGTAIVLLGGGEEQIYGWSQQSFVMSQTEAERVVEAARVFHLVSPDWIVSSGGGPPDHVEARPSSEAMREALIRLGVPASRILLESVSHDTHDEAVLIAPILRQRGITHTILVTSAVHMPRSIGTFRALGIDSTPASAPDSGPQAPWDERYLPSRRGIEFSAQLAHELVGIPYYWIRGWYR
jgi:uncharacterized SAM-binding protein YcdF (DUF218 family)